MSNKRFETRVYTDGTTATGPVPLPEQSPRIKHDYPACAIFRGGKCTCDEADKLCPRCGLDQWDTITAERGRERDVPFNRCIRCDYEWPTTDAEPEPHTQLSDEDLADCGLLSEFCTEDHPDHPIDLQLTGEIVAMRGDFDGYGYRYIDGGSGSDWRTRNPDWEPLVLPMLAAAPEAPAQAAETWRSMPAGPFKALHQARHALLRPAADGLARRCAIDAIDEVLAAPETQAIPAPWREAANPPGERGIYLVRIGDQTHVAQFDPRMVSAKWWKAYGLPSRLAQEPTHWMPLPTGPDAAAPEAPAQASAVDERAAFEAELRRQCFQKPTSEARDLAWCMWQARAALASTERQPLTDEQIVNMANPTQHLPDAPEGWVRFGFSRRHLVGFARSIERAHGIGGEGKR